MGARTHRRRKAALNIVVIQQKRLQVSHAVNRARQLSLKQIVRHVKSSELLESAERCRDRSNQLCKSAHCAVIYMRIGLVLYPRTSLCCSSSTTSAVHEPIASGICE